MPAASSTTSPARRRRLGEREAALGHLRRALEIHPGFAEHVHSDDDLASLRDDPGFPPPAG